MSSLDFLHKTFVIFENNIVVVSNIVFCLKAIFIQVYGIGYSFRGLVG